MRLKLDFAIDPPASRMSIRQPVMLLGSCFAEHIGERLQQHHFAACINPNGILFNPVSITRALLSYADEKWYDAHDLFLHDGLWYSWQHHGSFANADRDTALQQVNASRQKASQALKDAACIVLTFGSAYVYEHVDSQELVANCHKVPQQQFTKRLLGVREIISVVEQVLQHPVMQGKQVVLSISPVRYVRDGITGNNHSKAVLIRSVHELVEQYANMYYFPAYEIVIDELRDYRFYEADLVHPSRLAVDYVWERFCGTMLDEESKGIVKEVGKLLSAKQHRPLHPGTLQHRAFLRAYHQRTQQLKKRCPFLDLETELGYFAAGI